MMGDTYPDYRARGAAEAQAFWLVLAQDMRTTIRPTLGYPRQWFINSFANAANAVRLPNA